MRKREERHARSWRPLPKENLRVVKKHFLDNTPLDE